MSDFGDLVLVIGDYHIPQRAQDLPECFKELLQTDRIKTVLCTGNCGSRGILEGLDQMGQEVHCVRGEIDDKNVLGRDLPDSLTVAIGSFRVGLISGYQVLPWESDAGLQQQQRKLDCDILITGHTHVAKWRTMNGKLFLNPGSVTGASNPYLNRWDEIAASSGPPSVINPTTTPVPAEPKKDGEEGADGENKPEGEAAVAAAGAAQPATEANATSAPIVKPGKLTPSFMILAIQQSKVVVYIYKEIDGETVVDQFEHSKVYGQ